MMASNMMAAFFKWVVAMYHAGTNVVPIMKEVKMLTKQQANTDNEGKSTSIITEKVRSTAVTFEFSNSRNHLVVSDGRMKRGGFYLKLFTVDRVHVCCLTK